MGSNALHKRSAGRSAVSVIAIALLACLVMTLLGLAVGGQATSFTQILAGLRHEGGTVLNAIVWEVRLPRTLAAMIAGAGLGIAGSVLQTLTRNPVADAGLLGSNAGATVLMAIAMAAGFAQAAAVQSFWALAGSFAATAFVCMVGLGSRMPAVSRLVLFGVAFTAVLTGLTHGVMLAVPESFEGMRNWLAGSTVGVAQEALGISVWFVSISVVLGMLAAPGLELSRLGDDSARSLGLHLGVTRTLAVLCAAFGSSAATALVGPIGFVGLIAGHGAARADRAFALGAVPRLIIAGASGAGLLVTADVVGRVVLWPGELAAGIVASVVGAPILLVILRRDRSLL